MKIDIRHVVLIILLALSAWFIVYPYLLVAEGVKVISISADANCRNLKIGGTITYVGGSYVRNAQEFNRVLSSFTPGEHITITTATGLSSCDLLGDGSIGVSVSAVSRAGLRFGIDVSGGEKITFASDGGLGAADASYISQILERRLNVVGAADSVVSDEDRKIVLYTADGSIVAPMLETGKIEASIEQQIKLINDSGQINVGNNFYNIAKNGSYVSIGGGLYAINESFNVSGIAFKAINTTNDSVIVSALVFDNEDISEISGTQSYVHYDASSGQYQFNIPITLSDRASEKFSKITNGLTVVYGTSSSNNVLNGVLIYYLDGVAISKLSIPSTMAGTTVKTISIVGGKTNMNDAVNIQQQIEIAMAGELGKTLFVESIESFPGELSWVVWVSELLLAASVLAMTALAMVRYRNLKVALLSSAALSLEIFYIFGIVAITQAAIAPGIILDSFAFVGSCAFAIASFLQIFMISEKVMRQRIFRRQNLFMILIFVASAVLLFTVLYKIGVVLIVGNIIGLLLVRPVYADFISRYR